MFGAETLDHIGIPIRNLEKAEKFYKETLKLGFHTRRKSGGELLKTEKGAGRASPASTLVRESRINSFELRVSGSLKTCQPVEKLILPVILRSRRCRRIS